MHVWATEDGAEIGKTEILEDDVLALGYANEGDQIIAISSKGFLYRWDARLEEQPNLSRLSNDKLTTAVFSPRGNLCLFGTDTRELVFWDIEKNKCIRRIGKTPTCVAFCQASEEAVLVGYEDTSIQFYDWDRELGFIRGRVRPGKRL